MKKAKALILISGLTVGISLLARVSLADVTVTTYYDGFKDTSVYKSPANANLRVDCRGSGICAICGTCHTSGPESETLSKLNQTSWEKHLSVYFPKQTYSLSEGQRISWGRDEGYYINQHNRLVRYTKGNKLLWTAPTGSRILKNKKGEAFILLFSGEPIR